VAEPGGSIKTPRVTQVALVVLLSVVWALVGLISVATMTIGWSGGSLRTSLLALANWRSVVFIVGFPVLAAGELVVLRRFGRRLGWGRESIWLWAWTLWFVTIMVLAFGLWGLRSLAMLRMTWGLLVPLSIVYMAYGMGRRLGTEPHCAKCGYPWRAEIGEICPECGSNWSQRGGTKPGRPARSLVLVSVGVVLLLLSFAATLSPVASGAIGPLMPTGFLVEQAAATGRLSSGAWVELQTRSLTPEQLRRLDEGLLDARMARDRLDRSANAWLEGRVAGSLMSPELTERFYDEMVELELRTREISDGAVRVEVVAINRMTPFGATDVRIIFGGFRVDGVLAEGTRFEKFSSIFRFDPWSISRKPGAVFPGVTVARRRDSATVVTAEAWVCYGSSTQLPWGDAWGGAWGMPDQPAIPSALPWVRHVTLSTEVEAGD
jgi:hypothetical protein